MIFAPGGQALLTAESGGTVIRWDIGESSLIRAACYRAGGNLTAAQWAEYGARPAAGLPVLPRLTAAAGPRHRGRPAFS